MPRPRHAAGAALAVAALLSACAGPTPSKPATQATPSPNKPAVTEVTQPGPNVRCNRTTKVCTYRGTASAGLTRLYFGYDAAERLSQPGPVDPVTGAAAPGRTVLDPIFKNSPSTSCDTLVFTCYGPNGADPALSARIFGQKAGEQVTARLASAKEGVRIVRYGDAITCDSLSDVCYDRFGAGWGVTRLYLGDAEGERVLERLRESGP